MAVVSEIHSEFLMRQRGKKERNTIVCLRWKYSRVLGVEEMLEHKPDEGRTNGDQW
jgi:hypothetical protein